MDEKKTTVSSPKKGTSKNKKKAVIAVVLVMALVIGATLAYLGTRSNDKINVFTGSQDIDLTLLEEEWGKQQNNNPKTEEERAKEYTPGGTYLKDPKLKNTSTGNDPEWVAMKVSFYLENVTTGSATAFAKPGTTTPAATYGTIHQIIDIQKKSNSEYSTISNMNNIEGWTVIETSSGDDKVDDFDTWAIYMYNTTISKSGYTSTLFDRIQIRDQKTLIDTYGYNKENIKFKDLATSDSKGNKYKYKYPYANVYLPGFEIKVEGAAIKNESTDNSGNLISSYSSKSLSDDEKANIKAALIGLFPS